MTNLTSVFFFVPGALEAALTFIVFFILFGIRRKMTTGLISEALAYAFALRLVIQVGVDLSGHVWNPWLLIVLSGLTAAFFAIKGSKIQALHWVAVLIGIVSYTAAIQTMTYVKKIQTEPVIWEIEESPQNSKQEAVINFEFDNHPNHGFSISSDAVATYLRTRADNHAKAEVEGLYHWGANASYTARKIDDFPLPVDIETSPGCSEDCSNPPFPTYDLGL